MIVIIIILTSLHCAQPICVTYEYEMNRYFYDYYHPDFDCKDGQQYQQTISFLQEFCAPPQILIQAVFYWRTDQASFSFKILTITTKEFQVQVQCDSLFKLKSYWFFWTALIDNQLLVVNDFMSSIPLIDGYRTALIPYPMQNTDYEISYSITSYSGGSPNIVLEKQATGFNLYVTGVSGTQLSGLGVQLIVGLKSICTLFDTMSITCSDVKTLFKEIQRIMECYLVYPTQFRIIVQQSIHDLIYRTDYYSNSPLYDNVVFYSDNVCHTDLPVIYKLYIYDFQYQPHRYKKIRAAHMMCMDHLIMHTFITQKLYFKEIDKTWSDIDTVSIPKMQYNDASISLVYSHACQPNRKITITILKQGDSNYIYTQYCHRLYNLITMYIHLSSQRFTTSELQFSLTASGVQIQEKMLDTGNTYQLLSISYQN